MSVYGCFGWMRQWFSFLLLFVFVLEGLSGEMKGLPAGGLAEVAVGKARIFGISAWGQR